MPRVRLLALTLGAIGIGAAPIILTDADAAVPFYGVGGISGGGATSRLLFDYPETTRSHIMDLLFAPQFGAALQQSKVEVGGDSDTTNGAEPSHRHDVADGGSYTRGYEWWMLNGSLSRNPDIITSALMWSAPRLAANPAVDGGSSLFTEAGLQYLLDWVSGAQAVHNISLDMLGGGWNEHNHNSTFIKMLRVALDAVPELSPVRIGASDEWYPSQVWQLALEMVGDPVLRDAVDFICTHVAGYMDHNDPAPAAVQALGKPLFQSEEHFGLPDGNPAACWAWPAAAGLGVQLNQNWVRNNQSSTTMWPHTYAWSSGILYRGKGFLVATSPWGDAPVTVCPPLWVAAHTTHFTGARGWNLTRGTSSGHVAPELYGTNVSYVTYLGPASSSSSTAAAGAGSAKRDFTLVVESMSFDIGPAPVPARPVTAAFQLGGGLAADWAGAQLWAWHTNSTVSFERSANVTVAPDGTFTLTIEPGAIYTITSVASAHPGAAGLLAQLGPSFRPTTGLSDDGPVDAPFPLPWADDFEGYANDTLPLYTSDMYGAFNTWALTNEEVELACAQHDRMGHPLRLSGVQVACGSDEDVKARPGRCVVPRDLTARCTGTGAAVGNMVLRQYVRQSPIGWQSSSVTNMATIVGNYTLANVRLSVAALIESPTPIVAGGDTMRRQLAPPVAVGGSNVALGNESIFIGLRAGGGTLGGDNPNAFYADRPSAYAWLIAVNGSWTLSDENTPLASGVLPVPFGYDSWHTLSLEDAPAGNAASPGSPAPLSLIGRVDAAVVFNVTVGRPTRSGGYVLLGTGLNRAQWDNLLIESVA